VCAWSCRVCRPRHSHPPGAGTELGRRGCRAAQTVLKHGWPQPNLAALQQYAMSAMPSTDCQYMLLALMMLTARPMVLVSAAHSSRQQSGWAL
jgi:hypothetical protein